MLKSKIEIKACIKLEKTDLVAKFGTVENVHKDCERNQQLYEFRMEVRHLIMVARVKKNQAAEVRIM